jgi:hypothetical protein
MNFEQREKEYRLATLAARLESNPLDSIARGDWINFQNSEYRLYVVEFESANYAGAPSHCLVWAFNEEDARDAAFEYTDGYYYEQDHEQFYEEYHDGEEICDDTMWATIVSVELLEGSEYAKYVEDSEQQRNFYEVAN